MLASGKHLHPCLIFVGKAGRLSWLRCHALMTKIWLRVCRKKCFKLRNNLAYKRERVNLLLNVLIGLAPGVYSRKHFGFIMYRKWTDYLVSKCLCPKQWKWQTITKSVASCIICPFYVYYKSPMVHGIGPWSQSGKEIYPHYL
jgi:hypothetical protein